MSISVVIPTYNRREFAFNAIESVLNQTAHVGEIIVVDDGSQDGTSDAIKRHFPEVNLLVQDRSGVSASRNRGIRAATSEWIALLDSDDVWLPQKISTQLAYANTHPHARLIHCDEHWVRNGRPLNQKSYHQKSAGDIFARSLERCLISPSAVILKRDLFEQVGYFDESLPACEDYDLWLRITARFEVDYIDEKLITKHGGHPDQLSKTTWGLDRFRIRALKNLLEGNLLDGRQRQLAAAMLKRKAGIFAQGARKRGRNLEAQQYFEIARNAETICA